MKQNKGLKRNVIDKYYTSANAVKQCIKILKMHLLINKNDLCIEPSAGNGAFIKEIKQISKNYLFYDLEPEHDEIEKMDYLNFDHKQHIVGKYDKIHIIGNPPFGRQSSIVMKFIKKSCEFCNTISFILPRSFKKDSFKRHFPLEFHLLCEYDLPEYSFTLNSDPYDVPCVFQVWMKKDTVRDIPAKLVPRNYVFVKKTENHDISFRRVGVYAGEISRDTQDKSIQSHYFIKFTIPFTDDLYKKIENIDYSNYKDNTVGPRSISKQELIMQLNLITC
jgi:hypothetical protein